MGKELAKVIGRIRPTVIYLSTVTAVLTGVLAFALISRISDASVSSEILALLVGIGVGGLMTIAGQVAQDPSPPMIPAETHERMMNSKAIWIQCEKCKSYRDSSVEECWCKSVKST